MMHPRDFSTDPCARCKQRPSTPLSDMCRPCRRDTRGGLGPSVERLSVSLPTPVYRDLCEAVPSGKRSGWVADLIARELDT